MTEESLHEPDQLDEEVLTLLIALDKLIAAWEDHGLGCFCSTEQAKTEEGEKCAYCEADALLAFYDEESSVESPSHSEESETS
jgi:hypothetical protein